MLNITNNNKAESFTEPQSTLPSTMNNPKSTQNTTDGVLVFFNKINYVKSFQKLKQIN